MNEKGGPSVLLAYQEVNKILAAVLSRNQVLLSVWRDMYTMAFRGKEPLWPLILAILSPLAV